MDNKPDKLMIKAVRDRQKRTRPGECQKYIRMVIDSHILSAPYGQEFITELNSNSGEIKYEIRSLAVRDCIIWERNMGQLALSPTKANNLSDAWQKENHVVRILTKMELLHMKESKGIHLIAELFQKHYTNMQHIVLFLRDNSDHSDIISSALMELQFIYQLKVFQVEFSTKELVSQIKRLSKSIAEVPYKKQKFQILDTFKKYLANDKKQCVRVEGTNGFGRLWQQHLNRLPLVTLEVAETIIKKYPCPKKLLDDMKNKDVIKTISDLKIKRSGPTALQSDRRIGTVLSNKLYVLYNSKDPNTII